MKWTTEAKVGAFTLIGVVLFVLAIIFVGKFSLFEPPQMKITGQFSTVLGLKEGNLIKYSGVQVGKVKKLTVTPKGVVVEMGIQKGTEIPIDSAFSLGNDGIVGDKFIQITPGHSTTMLASGDTIIGEGQSDMDKAVKSADEMMTEASRMIKSVNNVIGDEATQASLRNALRQSDQIMTNTALMTAQLNDMVTANKGNVNALTANMVSITNNMQSLTEQLDTSMKRLDGDGSATANMRQIAENMKTTTESVSHMAKSLEGVVTDPGSIEDVKTTLHNTAQLSSKLNRLTGGTPRTTKAATTKQAAANTNNTGTAESATLPDMPKRLAAETNLAMLYETKNGRYSPELNFRLFAGKHIMELGASHIGDGSALDLNYGQFLNDKFSLRGGIFDGDVGLGLDYGLGSPFSLSAAILDPNHRRYRFRSEFRLFGDTYGVAQLIRPYSAEHGGDYLGIQQKF